MGQATEAIMGKKKMYAHNTMCSSFGAEKYPFDCFVTTRENAQQLPLLRTPTVLTSCEPFAYCCIYVLRPGCRHVSRALAVCLHESAEYAQLMAHDKERFTLLLALAFPGQIQPPRLQKRHLAPTTLESARDSAHGSVVPIRDRETRENSLSCICSLVKVSASSPALSTSGVLDICVSIVLSRQKTSSPADKWGHF